MNLTDFLLARIAEDEEVVRAHGIHEGIWIRDRYLADCEAKRRIVEHEARNIAGVEHRLHTAHLGLPYVGHPDYREEWKP